MPVPQYTVPPDDIAYITSASIFQPIGLVKGTYEGHETGVINDPAGSRRHTDAHIDILALAEAGTGVVQTPANQHLYNDQTYYLLKAWLGAGYGTNTFTGRIQAAIAAGDTFSAIGALAKSHDHAVGRGGPLNQSATHQNADTNASLAALHHTLGTGSFQAAPGDHVHSGPQAFTGVTNQLALLLRNAPGDPAQAIFVVQNNAATTNYLAVGPTGASVTGALAVSGGITGTLTGTATGVVAGAISGAMIAAGAVDSSKIADGAVGTVDIAAKAITTPLIADKAVGAAQLADDAITAAQIGPNAVGAGELADGAVDTAALQDASVTAAKLEAHALDSRSAVGHQHGLLGEAQLDGGVAIQKRTIPTDRLLDGAVFATATPSLRVTVNPLRVWTNSGQYIYFGGADVDCTALIPAAGSGQSCYILLYVNEVPVARAKAGVQRMGGLTTDMYPLADPNTTPLAFVAAYAGMLTITDADIVPARAIVDRPPGATGAGGSGSPVGHKHGQSNESRVESFGLDEGMALATTPPSETIMIRPLHYRNLSGVIAATQYIPYTPAAKPAANSTTRTDLVALNPATGAFLTRAGAEDGLNAKPATVANDIPICYLHRAPTEAAIYDAQVDSVNGYIEDARLWVRQGSLQQVPVVVAEGGTGVTTFAQGLLWQSSGSNGALPLQTVPATSDATRGLAIAPAVVGVQSATAVWQNELGGQVVNASATPSRIGTAHVLAPAKTGAGAATDAVSLQVEAPAAVGANNAAAIFAGAVRLGGAAMPTNPLSVTGNADISGALAAARFSGADLSLVGTVSFPASPATGQTCYRSDWRAWFAWDGTAWRQTGESTWTGAFPAAPPTSFLVYRTDLNGHYSWNGSAWTIQSVEQYLQPSYAGQLVNTTANVDVIGSAWSPTTFGTGLLVAQVSLIGISNTGQLNLSLLVDGVTVALAFLTGPGPLSVALFSATAKPAGAHTFKVQAAMSAALTQCQIYAAYGLYEVRRA